MPSLHHIGYWVDDLAASVAAWGDNLDVGPFDVHEHIAFEEFLLSIDDHRTEPGVLFDHSAAFAAWGPIVVELAQVHAIDDRLAEQYGLRPAASPATGSPTVSPGTVSHVAWVVPDLAAESERLRRLGCRPINTARTGPIAVAWHHGGPLFPHPIELHQYNEVIAGMHATLAAAAYSPIGNPA